MKIMSKINITNPGRSKLPIGNAAVAKAPSPEVTVGNTFSAGVSRFFYQSDLTKRGYRK